VFILRANAYRDYALTLLPVEDQNRRVNLENANNDYNRVLQGIGYLYEQAVNGIAAVSTELGEPIVTDLL
jgi:hypothetical protein